LARTQASPTLFLLAKALRSQRLSERAARMDPMNLRAVASLAPGRQLQIENFAIAAHFTAAEGEGSKDVVSTYFSKAQGQLLQDIFAVLANAGKRNGTFVEVGVGTGQYLSNTYLMETELDWTGVLVEPNRSSHESIKACRKAHLDTRAATSSSGQTLEFEEVVGSGEFSRLVGAKGHRLDDYQIERYEVNTATLNEVFEDKGMPREIDFMSVDTEGSELDVLRGIDFNTYSFTALAIEHNYDKAKLAAIRALLERHGYLQVFQDISNFDAWFVHPSSHLAKLSRATT
jgi:FkbM family methyltransferase